jgi:hypothetical protein
VLLPDADPYFAWTNVEFLAPDSLVNEVELTKRFGHLPPAFLRSPYDS